MSNDASVPIYDLVRTVDAVLLKGNFQIKQWVCSKQQTQEEIKFLSYVYDASKDHFAVHPVMNWSPRHRGARKAPDITTREEVVEYIKEHVMTRSHWMYVKLPQNLGALQK